jgi:tetratricopeptide (TPR) repeat protein
MQEFVGFGAGRIPREEWCRGATNRGEALDRRAREMLYRCLNIGTTVAFLGAGMSWDRHKGWAALVDAVFDQMKRDYSGGRLPEPVSYAWQHHQAGKSDGARSLFLLQVCNDHWRQGEYASLADFLTNQYSSPDDASPDAPKPLECLEALLKLPIHRFATTNYDGEIERAIASDPARNARNRTPGASEGNRAGRQLGFTQLDSNAARLAEFVLAHRRPEGDAVFHCHGRYDDVHSIIATEQDYRRSYLLPREMGGSAFRQTIELLLSSNPLLFLGFSLSDPDFMRILEFLRAADEPYSHERTLFALVPERELRAAFAFRPRRAATAMAMEFYWQRYGLHVLSYRCRRSDDLTALLREHLGQIEQGWRAWRRGWAQKPKFKAWAVGAGTVHVHPDFRPRGVEADIAAATVRGDVDSLKRKLFSESSPSVLVLQGPGGCGKSHRALRLRELVLGNVPVPPNNAGHTTDASKPYDKYFFWSSYYADDWLTGVDALIDFLEVPNTGSRFDRLRKAVGPENRFKALIVFDGFERVLQPLVDRTNGVSDARGPTTTGCISSAPDVGRATSSSVREFLRIICEAKCSTFVLTSRLWPQELDEFGETSLAAPDGRRAPLRVPVDPLTTADLLQGSGFAPGISAPNVNRLCSLLQGHAYSLRLARWLLTRATKLRVSVDDLCDSLNRVPADRRASRMVQVCLERLDADWSTPDRSRRGQVIGVVERLAIFMSPVGTKTWHICLAHAGVRDGFARVTKELIQSGLVLSGPRAREYSLHPIVRGYVFHRLQGAQSQDMPNFTLAGFTTGTAAVDPGNRRGAEVVTELFETLMQRADARVMKKEWRDATNYCRAAFGVMRSRMDAVAAARWDRYDEYIRRSIRLANLVKQIAAKNGDRLWDFAEAPVAGTSRLGSAKGVLSSEELAWLINDLGLALCCEGNMYDTLGVWEYGYEINKLIEHGEQAGQFVVQSQLHLGHSFIELGELKTAREYLELTRRSNALLGDLDYAGRIAGYMGVLEHLSGNTEEAERHYGQAISLLDRHGNPRARSIFLRHWADLEILRGNHNEAQRKVGISMSLAESGHHPELVAYAHNTLGHVHRARRRHPAARDEYTAALRAARKMGIRRLEADVLSELARLALDQHDHEAARTNAMRSLRIANECGLGLRQCHALVVLGLATEMSGHRKLGLEYLNVAWRVCDQNGYWLRKHEIEQTMRRWGEA